jgi:ribonuclease P protein component
VSAGFPRDKRITRGPELQRVLKEGKRIRTKHLDVRVTASPLEHSGHCRVGIIVPKAKHSAVERNRLKRQLRELARCTLTSNDMVVADIVLIARTATYEATFDMLTSDLQQVRAHILGEKADDT